MMQKSCLDRQSSSTKTSWSFTSVFLTIEEMSLLLQNKVMGMQSLSLSHSRVQINVNILGLQLTVSD